ncbi:LOW QUALITY PROTEIN: cis-aconitate decarboxylase-like [Lampetra planeri]
MTSSALLLSAKQTRPLSRVPFILLRGPSCRGLHSATGGSGALLREKPQLQQQQPEEDFQQQQQQRRREKPKGSFSQSLAQLTAGLGPEHASPVARSRASRMMLDAVGVGLLGARTEVAQIARRHGELLSAGGPCTAWGSSGVRLSASAAAFVNGVSIHAMDFDDTWHPATHPSGSLLPALLAAAEAAPAGQKPSGLQLLLAFLVGVEVQGRLLRCSREANDIPKRFHPPTVVGTIGAAAGCARLLGLEPARCLHALAIAASFAGAPLANAATQAKPLHAGHAARMGLEAAALAASGLHANEAMFDLAERGFGAFYPDYETPRTPLDPCGGAPLLLEQQDVAFKRFPAHLGTHWVADAACALRERIASVSGGHVDTALIESLVLHVPRSAYVDRAFPADEHEARHSFQFVGCSALLDGAVTRASFEAPARSRPALRSLLERTRLEHPRDNVPSFALMYAEASASVSGLEVSARCDSFLGHWRRPLGREALLGKFARNAAGGGVGDARAAAAAALLEGVEELSDASEICRLLH